MYAQFIDARRVAVEYAMRDNEMWHVIDSPDGYRVISDLDKRCWYHATKALHTADPVFLRKVS